MTSSLTLVQLKAHLYRAPAMCQAEESRRDGVAPALEGLRHEEAATFHAMWQVPEQRCTGRFGRAAEGWWGSGEGPWRNGTELPCER